MQLNIPSMQVEFSPTPFKTTTKLRFFVMQKKQVFGSHPIVLYSLL